MTQKSDSFSIESLLSSEDMISHGRKKDSGPQLQFENNSRYVWLDRVHSGLSCQPFGPWVNMPDDRNTGIYQPYVSDSQNMWWKQLEDFRSESHEYLVASEDEFKSSKTQDVSSSSTSSNSSSSESNVRARKQRTTFSFNQLEELEKSFLVDKYPSSETKRKLSQTLKVQEGNIKTWFQNRRTKWKKEKTLSVAGLQDNSTVNLEVKPTFARLQELAASSSYR